MENKYRKCVGMMILNDDNKILVGKRMDHPSGHWQMPQGGIDENENRRKQFGAKCMKKSEQKMQK